MRLKPKNEIDEQIANPLRFFQSDIKSLTGSGNEGQKVPFDRHCCIFYERAEALWDLCAPLIQSGVRDGLEWLYIVDEHGCDDVTLAFENRLSSSLPLGRVIDAASLSLLDTPNSVDRIVDKLCAQAETALELGAPGLLLLIEMTWVLRTSFGVAYLGEYEAALHELVVSKPMRTVCLYNQRVFPAFMMLDGLRTHPSIYAVDGLHGNPYFLPPAVFLSGDARTQLQYRLRTISPALVDTQGVGRELSEPDRTSHPISRSSNTISKAPIYNLQSPVPLITSDTDEQRWKIHCLGRLRVYRQDGTLVKWNVINGATIKTKTLFAYLLYRGQEGATAEEITDLLWSETNSMELSLNRLYHTVHCLRMALSPELTSSRHSPFVLYCDQRYFLALPEGTWIDIPVFEQLSYHGERLLRENDDEKSLICHQAADKLYNGDLLEDIPLEYAANIEQDWCWGRRYWLREMYLKMLSDTAGNYRRLGDARSALAYCEKVLRLDPCSERAHQEMMRIFHATGRRDALERQYRLYCQELQRFDEGAPSPVTQALYRSLITAS